MTRQITDYQGKAHIIECIGCAHNAAGWNVPGCILITDNFHVHQDFEVPIPGFVIVATRRHVNGIDEFTEAESTQFVNIVSRVRAAQRKVLGIETVYLIQEEDTADHFHLWMLPRYDWMKNEAEFGRKVSSARPVLEYARENMKTAENIKVVNSAAEKLRLALLNNEGMKNGNI